MVWLVHLFCTPHWWENHNLQPTVRIFKDAKPRERERESKNLHKQTNMRPESWSHVKLNGWKLRNHFQNLISNGFADGDELLSLFLKWIKFLFRHEHVTQIPCNRQNSSKCHPRVKKETGGILKLSNSHFCSFRSCKMRWERPLTDKTVNS